MELSKSYLGEIFQGPWWNDEGFLRVASAIRLYVFEKKLKMKYADIRFFLLILPSHSCRTYDLVFLYPDFLTHYHTIPHFVTRKIYSWVWKTLWEKEKLLVTSNLSFSHNVFYPMWYLFSILIALWNVVCNLFQFGPVWNVVVCNGLS